MWGRNGGVPSQLFALTLLLPGPAARRRAGNASVPKGASMDLGAFSAVDPDGNPILVDQHV
jgi:hypothetical protein